MNRGLSTSTSAAAAVDDVITQYSPGGAEVSDFPAQHNINNRLFVKYLFVN